MIGQATMKPGLKSLNARPGGVLLLAAISTSVLLPSTAMPQARRIPQRRVFVQPRPRQLSESPEEQANRREAVQLISLFLRQGVKQPHVGEQITRLFQGMVRDARQIVKYAGPGRVRMEYLSPENLKGETILIVGGRFFQYKPGPQPRVFEGVALPEELQGRIRELLQGINKRTIQVRIMGEEQIAGQRAGIVEIHSTGGFYLKFWIDEVTGVRLKYQNLDPQGRAVSETFFTSIDYEGKTEPGDFDPRTLPNVRHEPLLPEGKPLATVQEAQQLVAYTIKQPAVPPGFHLSGIWVVNSAGRSVTIMRFTDGVNTYALFQSPQGRPGAERPKQTVPPIGRLVRNGVAHWALDGMGFTLIGNLRAENAQLIVDSIK